MFATRLSNSVTVIYSECICAETRLRYSHSAMTWRMHLFSRREFEKNWSLVCLS